jgi:hypothetical protein
MPGSSLGTTIEALSSVNGGGYLTGSLDGAVDPERLLVTEDDPFGTEKHDDELQLLLDSNKSSNS